MMVQFGVGRGKVTEALYQKNYPIMVLLELLHHSLWVMILFVLYKMMVKYLVLVRDTMVL